MNVWFCENPACRFHLRVEAGTVACDDIAPVVHGRHRACDGEPFAMLGLVSIPTLTHRLSSGVNVTLCGECTRKVAPVASHVLRSDIFATLEAFSASVEFAEAN